MINQHNSKQDSWLFKEKISKTVCYKTKLSKLKKKIKNQTFISNFPTLVTTKKIQIKLAFQTNLSSKRGKIITTKECWQSLTEINNHSEGWKENSKFKYTKLKELLSDKWKAVKVGIYI